MSTYIFISEFVSITDLSRLNQYIIHPVHPFPSAATILSNIPNKSRYFASLDAISSYHQVPLDEESSYLTTFLLPCGRYRYLHAPMGLCSSSDEWCWRSDITIEDVPRVHKLVDNYLITRETIKEITERIHQILHKCHKQNLIISRKKFTVGTKIKFAGFKLSQDGVQPYETKTEAIAKFPTPKNTTRIQSFLGLVNQLSHFIPNLVSISDPLRHLLKKNTAFIWLKKHEESFKKIKDTLTTKISLQHFDLSKPTYLIADASKLNGLGFLLVQSNKRPSQPEAIIQCGSRALSTHECNYAIIELECMAIIWAITKCEFFLKGCPRFTVITDHRPLLGIFSKPLADISNPRLVWKREKVMAYNFQITWLNSKSNVMADALSMS